MAAGRMWRAKEILQGTISRGAGDPAILEQYGRILDRLGDRVEAGKYLFLSGTRTPEYSEAIALFLKRHAKRHNKDFAGQLPASVRRRRFAELPMILQEDLRRLDVGEDAFGPTRPDGSSRPDRPGAIWAAAMAVIFVTAIFVGLATIASWLWRLLFH